MTEEEKAFELWFSKPLFRFSEQKYPFMREFVFTKMVYFTKFATYKIGYRQFIILDIEGGIVVLDIDIRKKPLRHMWVEYSERKTSTRLRWYMAITDSVRSLGKKIRKMKSARVRVQDIMPIPSGDIVGKSIENV